MFNHCSIDVEKIKTVIALLCTVPICGQNTRTHVVVNLEENIFVFDVVDKT